VASPPVFFSSILSISCIFCHSVPSNKLQSLSNVIVDACSKECSKERTQTENGSQGRPVAQRFTPPSCLFFLLSCSETLHAQEHINTGHRSTRQLTWFCSEGLAVRKARGEGVSKVRRRRRKEKKGGEKSEGMSSSPLQIINK